MRRPVLYTLAVAGAACVCAAGAGAQATRGAAASSASRPAAHGVTTASSGGVVAAVSAAVDTGAASASVTRRAVPRNELTVQREVFRYDEGGRRDPFLSLLGSSELRPMISDLRLAVVVYDPRGRSRAVLKEISTSASGAGAANAKPKYYNVRVGQTLGRMRVAAIGPKSVTFTILEFGESRQETLALNDSTTVRTTP